MGRFKDQYLRYPEFCNIIMSYSFCQHYLTYSSYSLMSLTILEYAFCIHVVFDMYCRSIALVGVL